MTAPRTLVWFSCGAASAVCAYLLRDEPNLDVVYIQPGTRGEVGGEHHDAARFRRDVEAWIGRTVRVIGTERYQDHWDVFVQTGFIKSPRGAACTRILKREVRMQFERPGDVQVFGYTLDEQDRADSFRANNPTVNLRTPLIEHGLTKADCVGLLWKAGITLHKMYRLGYNNANCIGCVKGGMGYWNKIRRDFPDTFETASTVERLVGHSILSDADGPVWLDTLDPARGRIEDEPNISCGLTCSGITLGEK